MPADIFAQIVATLATGATGSAGHGSIGDHAVSDPKVGHTRTDRADFSGRFDADNERQFAFGERHTAPAPNVDVIKPDRLDRDLHFARGRRGGWGDLDQLDFAVGNER